MNTAKSLPKYERAYRGILSRLKSGRYPVGSRIPTENELAGQFDISRVTIRRALDLLVRDGYVESKQGSGYTVLTLSPPSDSCLTSFTDAMLRAGREPTSRLLSITQLSPDTADLSNLPVEMQTLEITQVKRLRLVDDNPRMLVVTYAPTVMLGNASAADFPEDGPGQSILRILSTRFNLDWSTACEFITPLAADADMAKFLALDMHQPLLKQACTAFDDAGSPVFYEEAFGNGPISFNLSQQTRAPNHT